MEEQSNSSRFGKTYSVVIGVNRFTKQKTILIKDYFKHIVCWSRYYINYVSGCKCSKINPTKCTSKCHFEELVGKFICDLTNVNNHGYVNICFEYSEAQPFDNQVIHSMAPTTTLKHRKDDWLFAIKYNIDLLSLNDSIDDSYVFNKTVYNQFMEGKTGIDFSENLIGPPTKNMWTISGHELNMCVSDKNLLSILEDFGIKPDLDELKRISTIAQLLTYQIISSRYDYTPKPKLTLSVKQEYIDEKVSDNDTFEESFSVQKFGLKTCDDFRSISSNNNRDYGDYYTNYFDNFYDTV